MLAINGWQKYMHVRNMYVLFPLTISSYSYFLRLCKVLSMLHHGSVGRVQNKECYFMFSQTFDLFWLFFIVKYVFLSFSFLFLIKYQTSATEY